MSGYSNAAKVDTQDFEEIYNEYYTRIYNYIRYRVKDYHLSEDLVSQVFEKMIKGYHTYNSKKGKFSAWLFTIANNVVINYFGRSEVKKTSNWEEVATLKSKYCLEDVIVKEYMKELLLEAVADLDEREQNIIALKFAARLTNGQIAEVMEITESNVGTIIYRALRRLRGTLTERGVVS